MFARTHLARDAASVAVLVLAPWLPFSLARADAPKASLPTGLWGGEHIKMVVTDRGATLEYDCAMGRIDERLLLDAQGNFEARGVHAFERGGPRHAGEPPPRQHAARFEGWTDGRQMRLRVTLPEAGREVGSFSLGLGRSPILEKCL